MEYHSYNKNDPYLREAIYLINRKKCTYCGRLQPNNMHIYHILASKAKKLNDPEFNDYVDELEKNGFILDSIKNYNVSCPSCNTGKKEELEAEM